MISTFAAVLVRGAAGSAFSFAASGIATAQMGGGHGGMGGGMGGFTLWPFVWSVVLLSVVAIVAYGVFVHGRASVEEQNQTDAALSTLRSRYARGELSEEEFEERRRRLKE
ncbi:SHOCT domain-containing protein [Halobacterium sp. CBA1126]|uniref:SHOCT domain-containing protein n=1 Tax=Halobacterium TaxID=2239 RepID=UPI0012F7E5CB|nr:SHOCT domain-containing protein [Halobacterium sp. CBA1126]MUV60047.1 SHOCT domain-containing protein [Halobacterium sp. CBA1126]